MTTGVRTAGASRVRRLVVLPVTGRVSVLAAVLLLAVLPVIGMHRPSDVATLPTIPWWVFAALFAVTEWCVLRVRVRRQIHSISVGEVPLVMGLFLAEPHDLLLGRFVGSLLAFVLIRRLPPLKVAFNTALVSAGAAVAVSVFGAVLHGGEPFTAACWVGAVLATTAVGLLEAAALVLVVGWYEGPLPCGEAVRLSMPSIVVSVVVSLVGIVPVLAFSNGAAALPLAVTGATGLLGYRAFATLTERHASLERLYELSDSLAAAPGTVDVVASVLRQSTDLLRVGYAEIMLTGMEPGAVAGWSVRSAAAVVGPMPADGAMLALPFPPSSMLLVRGATPAERAFLAARSIREALVVPLRVDGQVAGHLLVGDRVDEERGLREGDGRLLETVANHSSVALRNGRLIERLHSEARQDELTGLPNRLAFREALDAAAMAAHAGLEPCVVMVLDFDGFKAINDTLGHQAGDDLLRILAGRLHDVAGADASVARLGGDEFAVLSTRCADAAAARELAARLLRVFDEPVSVAGTRLRLGGSLGIALGPLHGDTGSDLLRNADIAMYAAKSRSGGARLFSSDLVELSASTLTLASDLRDALTRDEIELALQPVVDLRTGDVHSVEVLARWTHPELGEVSPETFFAAAERSGQIVELSARVLDRALALCRGWYADGRPVRVAVNLAPRWLADSALPEHVGQALARHGVPADLLCLEITESSVIADPRRAVETLSRLRDMGVHLSVDDFGTGYSSLTYLTRLPVDQMKIDKSFVLRLHESQGDRAIAHSILDLGRNLGLDVVAEGVTDEAGRQVLLEMGCTLAQGYLFSRPISPDELPALLDRSGGVARATAAMVVPAPARQPRQPRQSRQSRQPRSVTSS